MKYELAKKLKDAGWPQEFKRYHYVMGPDGQEISANFPIDLGEKLLSDVGVVIPTLSELIEACGDSYWSLTRLVGGRWELEGNNFHDFSDTPEEAVANLWLKINGTTN